MALISPGVQVSVIDESFYTPAEPGTRPLFIVATAANKRNAAGTGTAQGTLASNAGRVFTLTSQRDLADTFGDPSFKVDNNNNPIHAGELNEYGLQAAYSFLGVSNSALVVRANLDLDQLAPAAVAPGGDPQDGTFWLDTGTSAFGVQHWNGTSFVPKTPMVVLEASKLTSTGPLSTVGQRGDYAICPGTDMTGTPAEPDSDDRDSHELALYYKKDVRDWVLVGSDAWKTSIPVVVSAAYTGTSSGTITINGTELTIGISDEGLDGASITEIAALISNALDTQGITAAAVGNRLEIYSTGVPVEISTTGDLVTSLAIANGVYNAPALAMQAHTQVPQWKPVGSNQTPRPVGSVWIKTTEPNAGARIRLKRYNGNTNLWDAIEAPMFESGHAALAGLDKTGGGINLALNSAYVQYNFDETASKQATFRVVRRARVGATVVRSASLPSGIAPAEYVVEISESITGSTALSTKTVIVSGETAIDLQAIASAITAAGFTNVIAAVEANRLVLTHVTGGDIRFVHVDGQPDLFGSALGMYSATTNTNIYLAPQVDDKVGYVVSNWIPLTITPDTATVVQQSYYIQDTTPSTLVGDSQLWYSSVVDQIDIMVHNGTSWVGYRNYDHGNGLGATNVDGPFVSASAPTGVSPVNGDLWIDTSDLENYPAIKRYDYENKKWVLLDKSDQTSENGVLFGDARWATAGVPNSGANYVASDIAQLLESDFLDTDAPDPALYPQGMLLWNTRRSGFNVKKFVKNYIDVSADNIRLAGSPSMETYYPHRWVTESANQADGSGSFGRKAQRKVVQQALQALVNSNEEIRDTERNGFNLLACPGYPELIGEMISLNYDRGLTAFIVGDTPARLLPNATALNNWGTNLAGALEDNDKGLVSADEYLGVFYPWGFTSDNAGRDIAVPPSHMICRMIALSDQVSYPWFAPAGTRRGGITNASAVGYVDGEGEFRSVALNDGQRDTLYNLGINPITQFIGAGLVNFGQKTRARNASSLDRINVARLVIYLRNQLNRLAKPYIFEPNDKITRDEIKQQVESLLVELVAQRALYDFLVVCDESNNTPNRIDRNELYVDIAIEPVKAVEFIYIPVRLKNTGEISG